MKKKILLIASYDSFLRSGIEIAKTISNADIEIKIRTTVSNQLSEDQLKNIFQNKVYNYSFFYLNDYKNIDFNKYDIIILSAGNGFMKPFFEFYMSNKRINRSKIITMSLFPGVIFGDINSIVARINSDILLCNNKMDYEVSNKIKKVWKLNTTILHYGFPVIKDIKSNTKENIYFFEQVKIPNTYVDRMFILRKLIDYAFENPNETIYIKPRVSKKEKTVHINKYPMEKLLRDYQKNAPIPSNLFFTYQSIDECFSKTKLAITMSSTVAFEAMYNNIPVAIISDFGIRNEFANKDFLDSGCMISFSDLNKIIPKVNQSWYNSMVDFPKDRVFLLNQCIDKLRTKHVITNTVNTINTETDEYIEYKNKHKKKTSKQQIIKFLKNPKFIINLMLSIIHHERRKN